MTPGRSRQDERQGEIQSALKLQISSKSPFLAFEEWEGLGLCWSWDGWPAGAGQCHLQALGPHRTHQLPQALTRSWVPSPSVDSALHTEWLFFPPFPARFKGGEGQTGVAR